jgi:hypothetical protein
MDPEDELGTCQSTIRELSNQEKESSLLILFFILRMRSAMMGVCICDESSHVVVTARAYEEPSCVITRAYSNRVGWLRERQTLLSHPTITVSLLRHVVR